VDVVYADPAWSFDDKGSRVAPDNEACGDGYNTMATDDIASLPISGMARDDAALFLWSTWTHVLNGDATRVAKAWGFDPKVVIPWVKLSDTPGESKAGYRDFPTVSYLYDHGAKLQIGAGHYVRGIAEPLIVATRGSMTVPPSLRVPGVICLAPRSSHSAKPQVTYDLIERLYPDTLRLELFARRAPPREGWAFVGNQQEG